MGVVALILIMSITVPKLFKDDKKTDNSQVAGTNTSQSPEFNPLIPANKSSQIQKFTAVSCPKRPSSICFTYNLNGVTLTASQQKLPPGEKIDQEKLLNIAKTAYTNAVDHSPITTKNGIAVITSYDEINTQNAYFYKDGILMFVQSSKALGNDQWQSFFESLVST